MTTTYCKINIMPSNVGGTYIHEKGPASAETSVEDVMEYQKGHETRPDNYRFVPMMPDSTKCFGSINVSFYPDKLSKNIDYTAVDINALNRALISGTMPFGKMAANYLYEKRPNYIDYPRIMGAAYANGKKMRDYVDSLLSTRCIATAYKLSSRALLSELSDFLTLLPNLSNSNQKPWNGLDFSVSLYGNPPNEEEIRQIEKNLACYLEGLTKIPVSITGKCLTRK
ncbi:MAG: hypothetical protein HZB65_04305 [Candidatus Aenigmarchaeota archaeon]|nr:hypothetical protein [Candidatus Aenigmarchaeota archaeon]